MFDNIGDWKAVDQAALDNRKALQELQDQDTELGEGREWIRAQRMVVPKRSRIVVAFAVVVIALAALMASLIVAAYQGVHLPGFSSLWTPWPGDNVKLVFDALLILGAFLLLSTKPKPVHREG